MTESAEFSSAAPGERLHTLQAGMPVLSATGDVFRVSDELAAEFAPGDTLIANPLAGLLRIPAATQQAVTTAMAASAAAFDALATVADDRLIEFFHVAAARLNDVAVWAEVERANAADVAQAKARGRSTTRLVVSEAMRAGMIDGLNGWAALPSRRDAVLERIEHTDFDVELVGAALGPVGFVFEGRPNVLADACGVLRGGNTVVFRIGSDALGTARSIMQQAIVPALLECGLPAAAVTLIDSAAHAAGWALFLDQRLALAVARGSGFAVDLLGSLAQSVGTPVSLHGTGGAWMVLSSRASSVACSAAITRSLDRKVCNTLNTLCVPRAEAVRLVPAVLSALDHAASNRGAPFKLHVTAAAAAFVPASFFERKVAVVRAAGPVREYQAEHAAESDLGVEWEWEDSPEITLTLADSIAHAVTLFNTYSPRLVATLISPDAAEHAAFFAGVDAPFVGDDHTRWVDGQFALNKPELGLSNWAHGRLFGRGAVLTGDSVYTVRTRYTSRPG